MERVNDMVAEKPVVIFGKSYCCMTNTMITLFCNYGVVNRTVYRLDEIETGQEIEQVLSQLGFNPVVPMMYIGGELVGGAREVITLHLEGALKPMLTRAGAL